MLEMLLEFHKSVLWRRKKHDKFHGINQKNEIVGPSFYFAALLVLKYQEEKNYFEDSKGLHFSLYRDELSEKNIRQWFLVLHMLNTTSVFWSQGNICAKEYTGLPILL